MNADGLLGLLPRELLITVERYKIDWECVAITLEEVDWLFDARSSVSVQWTTGDTVTEQHYSSLPSHDVKVTAPTYYRVMQGIRMMSSCGGNMSSRSRRWILQQMQSCSPWYSSQHPGVRVGLLDINTLFDLLSRRYTLCCDPTVTGLGITRLAMRAIKRYLCSLCVQTTIHSALLVDYCDTERRRLSEYPKWRRDVAGELRTMLAATASFARCGSHDAA